MIGTPGDTTNTNNGQNPQHHDGDGVSDRAALIKSLMSYHAKGHTEAGFIGPFLSLLATERCFYRDHFPGHITGSALLLNPAGNMVLMNHHKTLGKWLSFGGHADGEEDILSVAIRETMEESGITAFKPLSANFVDIDIHKIPANPAKGEPDHLHYDIRYIMQMTQEQRAVISDESISLAWLTFAEAMERTSDDEGMQRLISKAMAGGKKT